jgi:hypothetical protein
LVEEIKGLLSTSLVDWAVTDRDAKNAIGKIDAISSEERLAALEKLGPDLLSKLVENLSARDRAAHASTLDSIAQLRNVQVAPPDQRVFLEGAHERTRGVLGVSWINTNHARDLMDGLRRFDAASLEAVLDALGPDKVSRIKGGLSKIDAEIYAPTLARMEGVFFGNVKRFEEAAGLGAQDRGTELIDLLAEVKTGAKKLGASAQQFAYLLAPGLVTEHQPGYFEANKKRMTDRGLTCRVSKLDTDADIATNAKTLVAEIEALARETGKKVIVLSHSKGGPDAALALRDPRASQHTALFISMQAAYGGTPISDPLSEGPLGNAISNALSGFLGATNGKAFADLSFGSQKARWKNLPPLEVPVLNLATSIGNVSGLKIVADMWKRVFGIESDGLVPLDSQVIGGKKSWVNYLRGVDHAGPAARPLPGALAPPHSPGDLTEALILQGLGMIGAR